MAARVAAARAALDAARESKDEKRYELARTEWNDAVDAEHKTNYENARMFYQQTEELRKIDNSLVVEKDLQSLAVSMQAMEELNAAEASLPNGTIAQLVSQPGRITRREPTWWQRFCQWITG